MTQLPSDLFLIPDRWVGHENQLFQKVMCFHHPEKVTKNCQAKEFRKSMEIFRIIFLRFFVRVIFLGDLYSDGISTMENSSLRKHRQFGRIFFGELFFPSFCGANHGGAGL